MAGHLHESRYALLREIVKHGKHVLRTHSRLSFTIVASRGTLTLPAEKLSCRRRVNQQNTIKAMGDKSPKSTQKKSSQKQAKAISDAQKKREAMLRKQASDKDR